MAGAAVNTFRQLGMTLGIALLGAVFSAKVRAAAPDIHAGYASGIDRVALWSALAALAGAAVVALTLRRPATVVVPRPAPSTEPAPDAPTPTRTR
jgi:hypothetical protein